LIQVEGILCICYGLWLDKQYGFCSYWMYYANEM
jgi:hypothetical protein